jgi:hypothetical protein
MNRRELLVGIGGVTVGGGSLLLAQNGGDPQGTVNDVKNISSGIVGESSAGNMTQEFGIFSPGFQKIEFINLDVLRIHFGSHDMDGFGVRHASLDEIKDDIYVCTAPRSTGTRDVPLVDLLQEQDAVYPSYRFHLIAYEGQFTECGQTFQFNFSRETKGTATFKLPESIAPSSAFDTS